MTLQPLTIGRTLVSMSALSILFGSYIADWNETHVLNPNWPPHARFHNGQTMSMSAVLAAATLYYTFRPAPSTHWQRDSLLTAALINSMYTITGLSGILYPGAAGMDPEFGEGFPQLYVFGSILLVNWIGWWAETRRLIGIEESGKVKK